MAHGSRSPCPTGRPTRPAARWSPPAGRLAGWAPLCVEPAGAGPAREHEPGHRPGHRHLDPPAPRRRPAAARTPAGSCSTPSGVPRPRSGCCYSGSTSSTSTDRSVARRPSAASATWRPRRRCSGCCGTPRSSACRRRSCTGRRSRRRAGSNPPWGRPATPTCGCGCSPATACAACLTPPAPTRCTRRPPRPACGTGRRSGKPSDLRPRDRPRDRARARDPALGDRLLPPVHPRRRLPATPAAQRAEARGVLRLFDLPEIRDLGVSPRWLPVRAAFVAATAGTRRRA